MRLLILHFILILLINAYFTIFHIVKGGVVLGYYLFLKD
nr:hypothetical protein BAR15_130051 [Bartonella sp. AR 15-3]